METKTRSESTEKRANKAKELVVSKKDPRDLLKITFSTQQMLKTFLKGIEREINSNKQLNANKNQVNAAKHDPVRLPNKKETKTNSGRLPS